MGRGRAAIRKVASARRSRSSDIIYDATLNVTAGDAYLIQGNRQASRASVRSRMASSQMLGAAIQFYEMARVYDVFDEETLFRMTLNEAAALIELRQYSDALRLVQGVTQGRPSPEAQMLISLAHWGRGEHEKAQEIARRLDYIVTDLKSVGLHVGPHARHLGRRILRSSW